MKVIHYPNDKARTEKRQPAGTFRATEWSDAPGPGNKWALPRGLPSTQASMIIVRYSKTTDTAVYTGPLPEGVTYD